MARGASVRVSVIIHGTEDEGIVLGSFGAIGIPRDAFDTRSTEGHFGNRIIVAEARLSGREGDEAASRIQEALGTEEREIRLDKQMLVRGTPLISERGGIRVTISRPYGGRKDRPPGRRGDPRGDPGRAGRRD